MSSLIKANNFCTNQQVATQTYIIVFTYMAVFHVETIYVLIQKTGVYITYKFHRLLFSSRLNLLKPCS